MFVEALDRRILDRGLEERVQHVKTGLVGGEPGPLDLHAAESTHIDMPVRGTAPWASPVLELGQLLGTVCHEILDHILLAQPVAATHRIVEVILEAIGRQLHPRRTALGSDGVATHRIDLRDQRDPQRGIRLRDGNRRPQTCPATPDDHYVRLVYLHAFSFLAPGIAGDDPYPPKPCRESSGRTHH
ncbi:MAG: hypothetical protein CAPSK01_003777 [Candidatus Accumulibacter vicinus]|uniref:Uncharacterized protein n=1 Tax=Candidatus Accumulibacter vicinus TaxID=2954382 RepID=A0A084XWJ4_9PROT|nr:MAG: hypothetical protein CAPSK01_003777 [Candidatus Accumulibacter vicinus]